MQNIETKFQQTNYIHTTTRRLSRDGSIFTPRSSPMLNDLDFNKISNTSQPKIKLLPNSQETFDQFPLSTLDSAPHRGISPRRISSQSLLIREHLPLNYQSNMSIKNFHQSLGSLDEMHPAHSNSILKSSHNLFKPIIENAIEINDMNCNDNNKAKLTLDLKKVNNNKKKDKMYYDEKDGTSNSKHFRNTNNQGGALSKINLTCMSTRMLSSANYNSQMHTSLSNFRQSQIEFISKEEKEYSENVNKIDRAEKRKLYLEQIKMKNKLLRESDFATKLDLINNDDHEHINEFKGAQLFDNLENILQEREKYINKELRAYKRNKGKTKQFLAE